jgi:hypothetical protein
MPKDIPVKDFWSVILYDNQTRSMLQTNQDWPAVSSQTHQERHAHGPVHCLSVRARVARDVGSGTMRD